MPPDPAGVPRTTPRRLRAQPVLFPARPDHAWCPIFTAAFATGAFRLLSVPITRTGWDVAMAMPLRLITPASLRAPFQEQPPEVLRAIGALIDNSPTLSEGVTLGELVQLLDDISYEAGGGLPSPAARLAPASWSEGRALVLITRHLVGLLPWDEIPGRSAVSRLPTLADLHGDPHDPWQSTPLGVPMQALRDPVAALDPAVRSLCVYLPLLLMPDMKPFSGHRRMARMSEIREDLEAIRHMAGLEQMLDPLWLQRA